MKTLFLPLLILPISAFAGNTETQFNHCSETAAMAVIGMLEKEDPKADLHIVWDEDQKAVAKIIDVNERLDTYELSSIEPTGKRSASFVFRNGDAIAFAEINLGRKAACRVTHVDMGQDDQD